MEESISRVATDISFENTVSSLLKYINRRCDMTVKKIAISQRLNHNYENNLFMGNGCIHTHQMFKGVQLRTVQKEMDQKPF